jgi:hypothetical protein
MIISAKSIGWGLARKDMDQGIANLLQDHGFFWSMCDSLLEQASAHVSVIIKKSELR